MVNKGLTASFIFEAESANYGEGVGNVASLKKLSRGNGESYTYISRQAIRYNIVNQMGVDNTPLGEDSVIQFAPDASIKDYPEIDLFGYMKTTKKPTITRAAVARLSNAIALESFNADIDFLTNKGLLDRYNKQNNEHKDGGSIAQSEVHKSYYAYTITIDLDKVGIDENDKDEKGCALEIPNSDKAARVKGLLTTIKLLYRDIKGRRENLSPIFAIGGVYDIKNPFFENKLHIYNDKLKVNTIKDVMGLEETVKAETRCGLIKGIFINDDEIDRELQVIGIGEFFSYLNNKVDDYYRV